MPYKQRYVAHATHVASITPILQMWAPVMGGTDTTLRAHSATRCVQEGPQHIEGFWICGLGTGEARDVRQACIEAALGPLPAHKPRGVSGIGTTLCDTKCCILACFEAYRASRSSTSGLPEEVLDAVARGVDLVEGSYPLAATQAGWALSFEVNPPEAAGQAGPDAPVNGVVNLWSREYAEDGRPLVEGCTCFACSGYTRAYVHHLLETHEMLAAVLLELHNTHHWWRFMAAIREAIVGGRFEMYKKAMLGL